MDGNTQPVARRRGNRDGLASIAIISLTVILIVFSAFKIL
jgi:hypothetical protein